jgi:hypothetical protein
VVGRMSWEKDPIPRFEGRRPEPVEGRRPEPVEGLSDGFLIPAARCR